ncbi:hypothetical protein VCRA2120E330_100025 [Vibrio crassostreae]|nr:hypothetical protein VCRA2120E330_100025 [Vibrio crassostreae]CAK3734415.1 hypothetical protein VCRA2122O340_90025 [Vibrio crassostreae]CAK3996736.1 hypothetical protein VCRA2128O346_90025 [Vibrio crassostreae]
MVREPLINIKFNDVRITIFDIYFKSQFHLIDNE